MSPDEAFAEMIGIEPVKGIFFLASGKTAIVRAFENGGLHFRSAEGKPAGSMIVAIDMGGEREVTGADGKKAMKKFPPAIVGGILVADTKTAWEAMGNGWFRLPMAALFGAEAVLYEAIGCSVCGVHPAPFGVNGEKRCGGHNGAQGAPAEAERSAEGGTPGQGVLGI